MNDQSFLRSCGIAAIEFPEPPAPLPMRKYGPLPHKHSRGECVAAIAIWGGLLLFGCSVMACAAFGFYELVQAVWRHFA